MRVTGTDLCLIFSSAVYPGQLTQGAGPLPSRRTWERRLKGLPSTLPAQIGYLGRYLIDLIRPRTTCGRAVAIDSAVLCAYDRVWHQKHRDQGEHPHISIDSEAHWTKSG